MTLKLASCLFCPLDPTEQTIYEMSTVFLRRILALAGFAFVAAAPYICANFPVLTAIVVAIGVTIYGIRHVMRHRIPTHVFVHIVMELLEDRAELSQLNPNWLMRRLADVRFFAAMSFQYFLLLCLVVMVWLVGLIMGIEDPADGGEESIVKR